jgi:Protein of unknown function (DUF1460)
MMCLTDRRSVLRMLAGVTLAAAGGGGVFARDAGRMARLIGEASAYDRVSARIDFISRALIGSPYRANTLIGGPRRREVFIVRDDAFDCVTYCEIVLAAARARDYGEFESALRAIRYVDGIVRWDARNHYFSEWIRQAIANGVGQPITLPQSVTIEKTVDWGNLGRRQVAIQCVPADALLALASQLATGDVIGFVSRRARLDFFHTGFVVLGSNGDLILRHAAQSRRRVVEEPLARFVAVNGVRHAALLRASEQPSSAGRS